MSAVRIVARLPRVGHGRLAAGRVGRGLPGVRLMVERSAVLICGHAGRRRSVAAGPSRPALCDVRPPGCGGVCLGRW